MSDLDGGDPFNEPNPLVTVSGGAPNTDFSATGLFSMTRLTELNRYVRPHCAECPRPVIEQNLRLAAIEFCERTRCWRFITKWTFEENNEAIVAPDYATIHEIESAYFDGDCRLTPTQFSDIEPSILTATDQGPPAYVTQVSENSVAIVPFQTGELRLTLYLKPRSGSEFGKDPLDRLHDTFNVIPTFMAVQHAETLAHGALARIFAMPDAEYMNPGLAAYHKGEFDRKTDGKFSMQMRGQHRAKRRTKLQLF